MARSAFLTRPGGFVVGCNYWASHAGTAMWSDWRPDVVEADLRQLARDGMQVLRVFPLWPDFQPIRQLYGGAGRQQEIRFGEAPLADDEAGRAGVDPVMMDRFRFFADTARDCGLRLIVGLVTGWMSGRLFVPPALEGRNVLTDPVAVMWQTRLVRHFVRSFRSHEAVAAWDLGNECNCMARADRAQAWVWTSAIASAIRAEDAERPVVSGMHSLSAAAGGEWRIEDQAELTDVLTTHPYPPFTPACDQDPLNTMRSALHATAESRLYADLGGGNCLVEEIGTLGPMFAGEAVAADYARTVLFSSWAHDCRGLLWWCAYDQSHLERAPYDWNAIERELGLFRPDRSAKPVAAELAQFRRFLEGLPVAELPSRTTEAVCILTGDQDNWPVAFASFILAKQAGFDLSFRHADRPLPESNLYLLPCVSGMRPITRRRWLELLDRVRAGATLYVSLNDGFLSPFGEPLGIEIQTRRRRAGQAKLFAEGLPEQPFYLVGSPFRLDLVARGAEVLGREADGNPALTRAALGRGTVYFLAFPIEMNLAWTPGAFHSGAAQPFWRIYRQIAAAAMSSRAVTGQDPRLGVTEHPLGAGSRVIVVINYGPIPVSSSLTMAEGWHPAESWRGEAPAPEGDFWRIALPPNDAAVFVVRRQG